MALARGEITDFWHFFEVQMEILEAIDKIFIGYMLLIGINHLQVVLLKNIQIWP